MRGGAAAKKGLMLNLVLLLIGLMRVGDGAANGGAPGSDPASVNAPAPETAKEAIADIGHMKDPDNDSVYVMTFYTAKDTGAEADNESAEVSDDLGYALDKAVSGVPKCVSFGVMKEESPQLWRAFNPRGKWLFLILHRGKTVLRSDEVMTDVEIRAALKKAKLI
jgi:hypothetical protein